MLSQCILNGRLLYSLPLPPGFCTPSQLLPLKHKSSKPLTSNELWLLELRIKNTRILASIPDALWDMCILSIADACRNILPQSSLCHMTLLSGLWFHDTNTNSDTCGEQQVRVKCLAQGHITQTLMRIELTALGSQVQSSTKLCVILFN